MFPLFRKQYALVSNPYSKKGLVKVDSGEAIHMTSLFFPILFPSSRDPNCYSLMPPKYHFGQFLRKYINFQGFPWIGCEGEADL